MIQRPLFICWITLHKLKFFRSAIGKKKKIVRTIWNLFSLTNIFNKKINIRRIIQHVTMFQLQLYLAAQCTFLITELPSPFLSFPFFARKILALVANMRCHNFSTLADWTAKTTISCTLLHWYFLLGYIKTFSSINYSTSEIRAKEEGKILLSSFSLHLHTVLDYLKLKWKKDLEFILSLFVIDQIYTFLGLTG